MTKMAKRPQQATGTPAEPAAAAATPSSPMVRRFGRWCVGIVPDHVQPGDAFVSKFLFEGTLCFFRLLCPETIHRGNKNRNIRVQITKEV